MATTKRILTFNKAIRKTFPSITVLTL